MTAPLKEFFEALTEQERKFAPTFADDRLGILLRTAINELDWYAYNLARAPEPTDEQQEQFYILRMGLSRAIKLALDARPSFDVPVGFIESMREAINLFGEPFEGFEEATLAEARTLFSVLSVGRDSTTLLDRPGCPLPPLIRCSEQGFIRCQTAAHSDPMHFLLDALRYHFRKEYDEHQRTREGAMQAAVKRVLDDAIAGLEYLPNIKIKVAGKTLTDIDLVVAEASTGAVLLIQLKHQDLYGTDIHSRNIRTDRLKEQIGRWLEATKAWIDAAGEAEVRSVLRLPRTFPNPEFHRIIVTRHYSYPIQDIRRDDDVAFANWNQFFNVVALAKEREKTPSLASVVRLLKENAERSVKQEHLREPPSEWIIDDLKFSVRQTP
ncbi:MAG: hypothetical protein KYX67_16970 [Brevundimonas sp.]|uniref:hypothetical protein n=1 Tax=Brevundimonas sp. TaxID=1871086 RepID=UPI002568D822|nr:hypothetical protein [Brevundimonas sp.]MDK2749010.1 hypothetical protein [Brevundimonas sp.]